MKKVVAIVEYNNKEMNIIDEIVLNDEGKTPTYSDIKEMIDGYIERERKN